MISPGDLETLLSWEAPEGRSILSLYVDCKAAQGLWSVSGRQSLAKSILRGLEARLDERNRPQLEAASETILSRWTAESKAGRSFVAFAESNGDPYWTRELKVPLTSQAHWGATPYLRPLIEAIEENERYGVVLTDKSRARLLTVFLGEIEEERDAFNPEEIKHITSTGSDQARTMNLQRRAEEHARWHLNHVAEMLDRMERERRFDRLILAGTTDTLAMVKRLLPKRLASRIVGSVNLSVEAKEAEVLEQTLEIERQAQRSRQEEIVEELAVASAKQDRAVSGLSATIEALREGRIWKLLYAETFAPRGRECGACASLLEEAVERCSFCNADTKPVEDLVEKMAQRVVETSGRVIAVGNRAAERLRAAGEIGAFLRF